MHRIKLICLIIFIININLFSQELISLTNEFNSSKLIDIFQTNDYNYFILYESSNNLRFTRLKYGFMDIKSQNSNINYKEVTPGLFSNQSNAKAVQLGKELFYIAFVDYRNDSDGDIYIQLVDKNGVVWDSSGIAVCTAKGAQNNIEMSVDSLGNVFVSWIDYRDDLLGDIYIQKIDLYGNEKWKDNGVPIANLKGEEINHSIYCDQEGGAVLSYTDKTNYYSQIYVQKVNEDGKKVFGKFGKFLSQPTISADYSKVFYHRDLGITIFWTAFEDKQKIHTQRINNQGIEEWSEYGEDVCTIKEDQMNPNYYFLKGYFYITFMISSYNQNSIYVQKLAENGVPELSPRGLKLYDLKNPNSKAKLSTIENNYLVYCLDSEGNYYNSTLMGEIFTEDGVILSKESDLKLINAEFDADSYFLIDEYNNKLNLFIDKSFGMIKSIFYTEMKKKENIVNKNFTINNFDVVYSEGIIKLWWITLNESESNKMWIEKKAENNNWEEINVIEIKGSSEKKFYTFEDKLSKDGIYYYRIKFIDSNGKLNFSEARRVVYSGNETSKVLLQNSPNPFNSMTKISFVLLEPSFVKITVYNSRAEEIETISNGHYSAGTHEVTFKANDKLSSGIYFYKLETKNYIDVKKMVYTK